MRVKTYLTTCVWCGQGLRQAAHWMVG
jgi:hypothetical protein